MKSKIFISYARKDYDIVVKLRDEIHRRTGALPWIDLSGIETGAQFAEVIAGAIDACKLLVFVISRNSVVSEWTRREVLYALEMHKKIYPVVIDEAQTPKELRLLLSNLNCIDIRDAVQRENLFSDLAADVNQTDSPISSSSHRRGSVVAMINGIKALRFKMMMALVSRSWVFYAVISILFLIAATYIYVSYREQKRLKTEIEPLRKFKADMEEHIERSKREARESAAKALADVEEMRKNIDVDLKGSLESMKESLERSERNTFWDSSFHTDRASHKKLKEDIMGDIAEIRVFDKANAEHLQSFLDKIIGLDSKEEILEKKIHELREKAKGKTAKGLDDEKEYLQAQKFHQDQNELQESIKSIADELNVVKTNVLERINRDWFWNLHDSKTCCLNSEAIRDCMKRSIAVIEVDDNRKEYICSLWEHFEKFVKDEELHVLERQEFAHLMKRADGKVLEGLDDSAELLRMRWLFFTNNFYYNHLQNAMHPSRMFQSSTSNRVRFNYKYYDDRNFSLRLESYMDLFRREICRITEEDKALSAELQASFNKLRELLAKESSLQRDIDKLCQKATQKIQKGLDDAEEFLQAQKIAKDVESLHEKELKALADKLYGRIRDYKPKKSRWDAFYTYRYWSLDLDPELIKKGIAEVSSFNEENAAKLQFLLDKLAEGNARAAPFQREIDLLRKKAKEKLQKEQDDTEEYLQAKEVYDKEWDLCNSEIKYQIEDSISILYEFIYDVRRGMVTFESWGKEDSHRLCHVDPKKKGGLQ